MGAALAAQCTNDQGKFWQYHKLLYSNQKPIDSGWVSRENLKKFASEIPGLDILEFNSCLDDEKYKTSIDMITTSEVAVSVTIDNSTHLQQIIKELEPLGTVETDTDQTIVSIVGNEIAESSAVLKKIFVAISEIPVRMVSYGGSRHNISLLIPSEFKQQTLQLINSGVFDL